MLLMLHRLEQILVNFAPFLNASPTAQPLLYLPCHLVEIGPRNKRALEHRSLRIGGQLLKDGEINAHITQIVVVDAKLRDCSYPEGKQFFSFSWNEQIDLVSWLCP